LTAASLFFYGWSNPVYLLLLAFSVVFNYLIGAKLLSTPTATLRKYLNRKAILTLGIVANVLFLGYFKYSNFFLDNINSIFGLDIRIQAIALPLAISFFTIQQIAFLVDTYRGGTNGLNFLKYCTFVTYFPKLLSGPIVRLHEMMPEIDNEKRLIFNMNDLVIGLTSVALGLFKKVILADHLAGFADPVFVSASSGTSIGFFDGWIGAMTYAFQLYFDFSGYCDMAIGIALMFGIRLPLNFYSPYKASSIIDFWRRWHITLSHFIRDCLYIPMGGSRKGFPRQVLVLLVAMAIVGLWHGAGWTFVIWGAMHGVYLVVNHGWRQMQKTLGWEFRESRFRTLVAILITFIAVTVAWVFFRADSAATAVAIIKGMVGLNGFTLPTGFLQFLYTIQQFMAGNFALGGLPSFDASVLWILMSFVICWFLPNVQEYLSEFKPTLDSFTETPDSTRFSWLSWKPSFGQALGIGAITVLTFLMATHISNFIYTGF
jgi:D-alanyl-lipoteichoic acid acyltransferase DltB (MBOAT superfamily)